MTVNQNLSSLSNRLKELRQDFMDTCRNDVPGLLGARTYADNFLKAFQKAFAQDRTPREDWALVAVGGFGRCDLSFASDLDLLFLYHRRLPQVFQDVIREVIYNLWDAGFEVGHVTSSLSGVNTLVQEDFSVLTTYLETRFIAGDIAFYENWRDSFLKSFGNQRRKKFLQNLITYRNSRLEQYGESPYLLEPHVKEGVGGLRDVHTLLWAGSVFLRSSSFADMVRNDWLTPDEERWLEQAHDFLWRVRLQLHQLNGRRQDQLLFPEQEQVAQRLGFLNGSQGSAEEAFMRLYYRYTARIRRTTTFFLERMEAAQKSPLRNILKKKVFPGPFQLEGRYLYFMEPEWLHKDIRLLMRFFWQAARSGAHLHHQTGQIIREHLKSFTEEAGRDPEVVKQFFEILLHPQQSFSVLKMMMEIGFLEVFIPEFAAVRYKAQYDVYHLYTVDEHLLRAVNELHKLENTERDAEFGPGLSDIFVQVENRRVLYLSVLLHDIGKGRGKNHSVTGAAMVRTIGERMGLTAEEVDLMSYLVENHLALYETALKRDLSEEKPILTCAMQIKDRERLRLLYLLSIADSRATGPGAWNTWKASLLRELYVKVDHLLLHGEWKGEDIEARSRDVQSQVLALAAGNGATKEDVASWLDSVSLRYLFSQAPRAILQHYHMERNLDREQLVLDARPGEGEMWQITVATRDRPGLFAQITGVLWAYGLNILSADIFTRLTGVALDVLMVERVPDPLNADRLWERVKRDLLGTLSDRDALDKLLADRRKPTILQRKYVPRRDDRVLMNEEASDFYTIIEVYTWDRPGVLHTITNTLFNLGITIQLARISTPGAQVADVFYVTDLDGNKLMSEAVHDKVRLELLKALSLCI